MRLRQSVNTNLKTKLSTTLRRWLPILQSSIEELEDKIKEYEKENPVIEVCSGFECSYFSKKGSKEESASEYIESLAIKKSSLYESLKEQINRQLFPTPLSESIAYEIILDINSEGYFEGSEEDIAARLGVEKNIVSRVRERFAYLQPPGVGAKNVAESMIFQLIQSDVDEPLFSFVKKILLNFSEIGTFKEDSLYEEAINIIRTFKNPPALEFMEEPTQIIPDIIVVNNKGSIEVKINNLYYPDIKIINYLNEHTYIKEKIKEARDLIDALEMRKATLYKIGLLIVELQYDFFQGGDIKPMKLKDIAEEFDHNPSTISRAIANKYLMCDRGIFPMKTFFSTAIEDDISNSTIKKFIADSIASEDRQNPLSDNKLLEMIEEKFGVKLVRRTVTKYRKQMGIGGSNERKKFYKLA